MQNALHRKIWLAAYPLEDSFASIKVVTLNKRSDAISAEKILHIHSRA